MGEALNCAHCHKRLKEGDYRNFDPQHYRPLQLKAAGCRVHHSCHIALARRAAAAVKAAAAEAAQREASGLRTTRSVSQQHQDAQPWQPRRYTPQAGEAERLGRAILTSTRRGSGSGGRAGSGGAHARQDSSRWAPRGRE